MQYFNLTITHGRVSNQGMIEAAYGQRRSYYSIGTAMIRAEYVALMGRSDLEN
jgi:hypothetical protein